MEFGLIAAIGWGVSSVAATHAARRMGTLTALLASQITGTIVLTAVLAAMRPHLLGSPKPRRWSRSPEAGRPARWRSPTPSPAPTR